MGRRNSEQLTVGEDSFLDTVANLVGIVIILVVVIGTKTKMDAEAYVKEISKQDSTAHLADPASEVMRLKQSLYETQTQLAGYDFETSYRKLERDKLLDSVTLARNEIEARISQVDSKKMQEVESTQHLETLQSKLKEVNQRVGKNEEIKRPKIVLEHLPTPMAKTVFGREMHIRVRRGLVTVIPWDRLVQTLKDHVPLAARRNASRKALEETLGPIDGFLLKYRMNSIPGGFELDRFELETTADNQGEPLAEALSASGRLRLEMSSRKPSETVVTVWVYPDSFDEFRQLKNALFQEGFLSAARPLPDGIRIGASPHGSRSVAQ